MPASLGTFIRDRRNELGLTQEEVAERIGPSTQQSDVSRLERGGVALPRRERLEAIAAALDVSLGELLVRSGWMTAGDDLAAAVLNVETLSSSDIQYAQGVADLGELVSDLQAMLADATNTIELAARTLAQAQQALQIAGQSGPEVAAVPSGRGRDIARKARVDRVLVLGHGHASGHDPSDDPLAVPTVASTT